MIAKTAVYRGLALDIHAAFEHAATAERMTCTAANHREGVTACRDKCALRFQGQLGLVGLRLYGIAEIWRRLVRKETLPTPRHSGERRLKGYPTML